ncbi:hypothetical protein [Lactobacillus helveticus]|uniref:hypothetical protein n=1 Tax=Lactobacillus helveticus TaxID=1587 RepID=UPI00062A92E5|nr:hypothetical protein [Lactobacillus helveticus]AKG66645.1 hypothetical protein TU99_04825 [Lactobacillus helveticus]
MDELTEMLNAVKQLSPDLTSNMSDDALKGLLSGAREIAIADGFPVVATSNTGELLKARYMATKYLALHLIAINNAIGEGGTNVTSEQVSVLKRTYADVSKLNLYQRSPWGQLYMWLYNLYGNGGISRYMVVQH